METVDDVTRMRLVGGDLALDFLNTRVGPPGGPPDDDVLTGYPELVAWSVYAGAATEADAASLHRLSGDRPGDARAAFARSLRTREYLDDVFRALASGRSPGTDALALLRDDEADALRHAELAPGDAFTWVWNGGRTLDQPVWPVIHSAVQLLTTGTLSRLKGCGGCSFLFYDESKNRSRRWCSMEDCGTAEKMRRYTAARRTRSAQ